MNYQFIFRFSLFLSLTLTYPNLIVSSTQHHRLVFEEIGLVAPSVSYLHVSVPLNLTGLSKLVSDYSKLVNTTFITVYAGPSMSDGSYDATYYFDKFFTQQMKHFAIGLQKVGLEFKARHLKLQSRIDHLLKIMPYVAPFPSSPYTDDPNFHMRYKRFLPFLFARGIFGTFMGLYNRRQYKRLQTELDDTIEKQSRLISWSHEVNLRQEKFNETLSDLRQFTANTQLISPIRVITRLQSIEQEILDEIQKIQDTVQHAQLRRLSSSLLPSDKLNSLFQRLKFRAESLNHELLIDKASDLFQIETSYFYDGSDITLIIHVPMAPKNSVLRLQKLLPFPLSFSDTHFITPRPLRSMFAISSDDPRMILDLSEADLEGCHRINSMHLCERLGVLSLKLDRSCLGSLYTQRFTAAMSLCNMEVAPIQERVLQLSDNWFLVYASSAFTGYVSCTNKSADEVTLKPGVNKIHVSPSCLVKLQDHQIYGDTALRVDKAFKEIEWTSNDLPSADNDVIEARDILPELALEGETQHSLSDLRQQTAQAKRSPRWIYLFIVIGVLAFLGLIIWIVIFVFTHKWWLLRRALRLMSSRLWPPTNDVLYEDHDEVVAAGMGNPPVHVEPLAPRLLPAPPVAAAAAAALVPAAPPLRRSRSQPPGLPSVFARARLRLV